MKKIFVRGPATATAPVCLLAGALLAGCVDDGALELSSDEQQLAAQDVTIETRRSLVVTEQTILERFTFQRVMDQLVAQSGVPNLTSLQLFHQWWDTQNLKSPDYTGLRCNDVEIEGVPSLNGYPIQCRPSPAEGRLVDVDPFVDPATNPEAYIPIALFNRFDLAPGDGSNCGEYRIVFARRGGILAPQDRNLVIFEMALANPHPENKLKGCTKIVQRWADLTEVDDLEERADLLEEIYFDGFQNVPPVVHVNHLGAGPTGAGQVRTNQFMGQIDAVPRVWSLREFKLRRTGCTGQPPQQQTCTSMQLEPEMVKGNPFGPLFTFGSTHPNAGAWQTAFVEQVPALAATTLADIDIEVDPVFDAAHSPASGILDNKYVDRFVAGENAFRTAIATKLSEIGSTLSPDNIVARAQALSCAGCHRLSNEADLGGNLKWPKSAGFVHVTEVNTEVVDGETRYLISPALTEAFLPKRKQVMEDFLNDKLKKPKKPKDPIGGRRVH